MTIINTPKPTTGTMTNITRVDIAELWSTITTTWASETRTWLDTSSKMVNSAKPTNGFMTNTNRPS